MGIGRGSEQHALGCQYSQESRARAHFPDRIAVHHSRVNLRGRIMRDQQICNLLIHRQETLFIRAVIEGFEVVEVGDNIEQA
ncbi:hypothetical protein D3C73_1160080 [compost metagenome]